MNQRLASQKMSIEYTNPLLFCLCFVMALLLATSVSASNREVLIDATTAKGHSNEYDSSSEPAQQQAISVPVIVRVTGYGGYDSKAKNSAR